ncbi:chemotaxis protein CheV [Methylophaga sp. OBS3]|uniref:chemotaxis protein CheV n=1 Tax=Methylophaga sp. OBS3 TaxID=2991934 RepID=UPI00225418BE|nr:chemotaxis protein CheV [Methylophaga sp. OBS3]MCX4190588.1 chemotaxis protein CheV [Methylophaga sp. OBS3]
MASLIDGVNQRTRLAGQNRLELLLFSLGGRQRYGINVFKVREAISCPNLTQLPNNNSVVKGIAKIRGQTVSIFDLAQGIGRRPIQDLTQSFVIITEYNRTIQGFLVSQVDRIVNVSWTDILPPPTATGSNHYMTAVTKIDDELIQIIDVEKVMVEVLGMDDTVSEDIVAEFSRRNASQKLHVLVADDSSVARNQIKRTLNQIGVDCTIVNNGREALDLLKSWVSQGIEVTQHIDLLISDIEMPEMDGYTLTTSIRQTPALAGVKILLHTSMSGTFNNALVEKVGADKFIAKFAPDDLAVTVQEMLDVK